MKKRLISLVMVMTMILTMLTACGGNSGSESSGGTPSSPTTDISAQEPASKTLSVALGDSITTLDPHRAANQPSYQVRNMCFDFLIQTNLENGFSPCLAKDWEFNEEGNEMTLYLEEGVKFHNGEDFTSADVVATFKRVLEDSTLTIANAYWSLLTGVEAIDDYTVKLILSQPYAGILNSLAVTAILPDEAWAEYGEDLFNKQLMYGTGPWVFDEYIDGQYVHVTKNTDYWDKSFDSYYDDVYVRIVLEASTAVSAMINGDVQAYIPTGGIASDIVPMFAGTEDKIIMDSFMSGSVIYLGLGVGPGRAFEDENLRKAAMLAIDRQTIVDTIYGGAGQVPDSFMPEGTLGYSDKIEKYSYDPESAKEYLAKSNYDGREIVMIGQPGTTNAQACLLAIAEMWNEIGINCSVEMVESAILNERRASGNYDVFIVSTMQEHDDPIKYLTQRVLGDNHHSGYVDEKMFDLIRASNSEMDEEVRRQELEEILGMWSRALVHIHLVQQEVTYAYAKGVSGLGLFTDGMYTTRFVTHE